MASVLIVEDTKTQASLVGGFLSDAHTVAGWARTADEAVSLVEETNPDAVVMDLNLADGNGIEATRRITDLDDRIAVIISTVNVGEEVKQRALEAGGDEYLAKPYSRDELLAALDRLC
jgi:DNA-binding response OmpR family regulator